MRSLLLFFAGAACAFAQPITAGIKAGVPLTDFFNTVQTVSTSVPNRYIIGATVELRLPLGLGVEADALYRRLHYQATIANPLGGTTTDRSTANSWEFPILLKYRFPSRVVRPFVDAGVAFDTLSGLSNTVTQTLAPTPTGPYTNPALKNNTTTGFVMGAGVDIHAIVLHISPEIRYTRWTSEHFNLNGVLNSNRNQAEFLLGITF